MNHFEVDAALDTLEILVDTREQPTPALRKRLKQAGLPYTRKKLDFGDYSARCFLQDGGELDLSGSLAIERKMNMDEICQCYTKGRDRFTREFERAKDAGAKIYLLIENGSWEKAIRGEYRSRMNAKAFFASLTAWLARYNCQIIFCQQEYTGSIIKEILYREMKEKLEHLDVVN